MAVPQSVEPAATCFAVLIECPRIFYLIFLRRMRS